MTNTPNLTSTSASDVYIFELPYGYLRYDSLTGPLEDNTQLLEKVPDKLGQCCHDTEDVIYGANNQESQPEPNYNHEHHYYFYHQDSPITPRLEYFRLIEYTKKFDHYLLNTQIAYCNDEEEIIWYNKFVGIVDTNLGPENAKQQCLEMLLQGSKEERIPSITECSRLSYGLFARTSYLPQSFHIKKLDSNSFERLEVKP